MRHLLRALGRAESYLTAVNILAAAIGFLVAMYVARILGPEQLGVTGVIAAFVGTVLAFIDVRFQDVVARLVYEQTAAVSAGELLGGAFSLASLVNVVLGLALVVIAAPLGIIILPIFTETSISPVWILAAAVSVAIGGIANTFVFFQRYVQAYQNVAVTRLFVSLVSAGALVGALSLESSIAGYYWGIAVSATGTLVVAGIMAFRPLRRSGMMLSAVALKYALRYASQNRSMVLHGNALSYAKIFQRSGDVLLVAAFSNDAITGIYRFARSFVDSGLAVLQDTIMQLYYPRLLDLASRGEARAFSQFAGRVTVGVGLATAALLVAELVVLELVLRVAAGEAFAAARVPIILLTASFFAVGGIHPWLWALYTRWGVLRGYTLVTFGSVAAQYGSVLLLFQALGPAADLAMVGALVYYLLHVPLTIWMLPPEWRSFLPAARWPFRPGFGLPS